MEDGVDEEYYHWDPHCDSFLAVSGHQRSNQSSSDVMENEEHIQGNVDRGVEMQAGEVSDCEDYETWYEVHGHVRWPHREVAAAVGSGVLAVRKRSPRLPKQTDERNDQSEEHQADVNPEAKDVVLIIAREAVRQLVGVIGKQEVWDSREEALTSIAGDWGDSHLG